MKVKMPTFQQLVDKNISFAVIHDDVALCPTDNPVDFWDNKTASNLYDWFNIKLLGVALDLQWHDPSNAYAKGKDYFFSAEMGIRLFNIKYVYLNEQYTIRRNGTDVQVGCLTITPQKQREIYKFLQQHLADINFLPKD